MIYSARRPLRSSDTCSSTRRPPGASHAINLSAPSPREDPSSSSSSSPPPAARPEESVPQGRIKMLAWSGQLSPLGHDKWFPKDPKRVAAPFALIGSPGRDNDRLRDRFGGSFAPRFRSQLAGADVGAAKTTVASRSNKWLICTGPGAGGKYQSMLLLLFVFNFQFGRKLAST